MCILNTGSGPLPAELFDPESLEPRCSAFWNAHNNCIFDLEWCRGDHRLATASGDQSIG